MPETKSEFRINLAALSIAAAALSYAPAQLQAAPPEFTVETFSDKVQNATALCLDDEGRVFVTETFRFRHGVEDNRDHTYWIMEDLATETNEQRVAYYKKYAVEKLADPDYFTTKSERVVLLRDPDGDGKAEPPSVFADGFNAAEDGPAIGLLADDAGKIYLASIPHVWTLEDRDGDLKAEVREKLISGFGVKTSLSGHDLHGLVWGPHDGKLYFSMGDRGYNVTTQEGTVLRDTNTGAVFRCEPDGSQLEIFYHNLRNPQEIAFNEFGDLFTVDNNCDQGDSARVCYLIEGGDAGWTIGTQALTTYSDFIDDGGMAQRPNWLEEGHWKTRYEGQPAFLNPPIAHLTNGPSGMAFNSGTSTPERYRNHFLVCDYKGAPNVCFLYSFKVEQQGAGYVMRDAHVFHSGVPNTDVDLGYDGKIYLADFGGGWRPSNQGKVYTLFDRERIKAATVQQTVALFKNGFPQAQAERLALLDHPDMRVRTRAQFLLARSGAAAVPALTEKAQAGNRHALWALRQIGAGEPLLGLVKHESAEVRAQAVRALGDLKFAPAARGLRQATLDKSPRVRSFAAIACGKLRDTDAMPNLIDLLIANDDDDLDLRHAAIYGLQNTLKADDLPRFLDHESPAVRLGVLLALRRQRSPLVEEFLDDKDPAIVAAAIRAINDLDIAAAVPALADFAKRLSTDGHGKTATLDEPLLRRVINANLRAGKPENAVNLIQLAANSKLPVKWRALALKAMETFAEPPPIDPTLGIYRPLEARDRAPLKTALEPHLLALFKNSTGEIAAGATRLITAYGIQLDRNLLARRVLDSRQPESLRISALQQLASSGPADASKPVFRGALADSATVLRSTAAELWVKLFPAERFEAIDSLLEQTDDSDLRTAYHLLAADKSTDSTARLRKQLQSMRRGELFLTVQLDLYEAIVAQGDKELAAELKGIDPFDLTREGGDPSQGRKVFENQGICLKCHVAERGGGDAGPSLKNIARQRRDEEILKSLLDPNDQIVPGYGIASITLKDGTSITGAPLAEQDGQLTIKDPAGAERKIDLDQIKARTKSISAMPPMFTTGILSKRDLRDLMAYLKTLK